ncbi:IS110 family RNA-guided transposase [Lentibacillus cibarius]|uniref:IS110 family transposase n=1 Tax=Lentibacillus cibarius TaxID=2583219 RepID=A0A5S3QGD7_9BACI|nr:IS110 family transposase [Lentibacillus cibarius]TMN20813.1 IS110 family transposase [Lentibacillus cibarius]TMN20908.1 IS110 family transposase [Lentibacillus cibarius]
MDPVIGLDIAKGESQVQAFLKRKQTYKQSFKFAHDLQGLHAFYRFYQEVEQVSGQTPAVIFESTGHYHEPVLQFLENHDVTYYLINPVVSYEARKTSLRKVKTDKIDAFHLGELYYKEDLEVFQRKTEQYLNLRQLTRQHSALTDSYVEIKLQFQAALDQIFPEYHGVFSDLYGKMSLNTLLHYPTSVDVQKISQETLATEMRQFGAKRSDAWFRNKAAQLKDAADRNPFQQPVCHGHIVSIQMYIQMLFQYQEHLSKLQKEIDALAESFYDYELIQSIPGIGGKIAATILSETGGMNQFEHPKQLAAYAGVDPSVFESGKFKASINKITKRGSSRLRQTLYTAVQCGLAKNRNKKLIAFYDRKRNEGKPHKVAVIACANKLIHWIHAMLKRQEVFVDQ